MACSCTDKKAHKLNYTVKKYSSYASSYGPSNILKDCPSNQASRWSSETNATPQFLLLELEKPCIVKQITFGKYEKTHVCNLRRFKCLAGLTEEHLSEVLESGLNNDHIPETFELKLRVDGQPVPIRYLKIVPLQSWGSSFNFTIWYVELQGFDQETKVNPAIAWYNERKEREAMRVCLKFLREHQYTEVFDVLKTKSGVELEDPLLTQLYNSLMIDDDFDNCERIMEQALADGLFNHFVDQQDQQMVWAPIEPLNTDGSDQRPGPRGGHQMALDSFAETLYLHGGFDGQNELADFWSYHIPSHKWTLISPDTGEEGGPSARSCHKIVLDYERKQLFVLGRYLDFKTLTRNDIKSDFYVYDIFQSKWTIISENTEADGGPSLLYHHQMVIDIQNQTGYVFGGKEIISVSRERNNPLNTYAGLYSYHIPTNHWRQLRTDSGDLKSRFGHGMTISSSERKIFIYGGHRYKEYLDDLYSYDIDTDSVLKLERTTQAADQLPPNGFTQRVELDDELGLLYVLLSITRQADKKHICNTLWIYNIHTGQWTTPQKTLPNAEDLCELCPKLNSDEPVPRFAHQFCYDPNKKTFYMFGGNSCYDSDNVDRLDDFWSINLVKPSTCMVLKRCRYLIRRFRYGELSESDPLFALKYLQSDLAQTIDHDNPVEVAEFQKLTIALFAKETSPIDSATGGKISGEHSSQVKFRNRQQLYSQLVKFFPDKMTQPKSNLTELVPL